jgi:hypothetical protein
MLYYVLGGGNNLITVCCYGDKPLVLDCFHSDIFLLDLNLKE